MSISGPKLDGLTQKFGSIKLSILVKLQAKKPAQAQNGNPAGKSHSFAFLTLQSNDEPARMTSRFCKSCSSGRDQQREALSTLAQKCELHVITIFRHVYVNDIVCELRMLQKVEDFEYHIMAFSCESPFFFQSFQRHSLVA
jgi:hypothetical protein